MSLRDYRKLKTKKGRDDTGLFVVEGEKFVAEIPPHWVVEQYIIAQSYAASHNISHYETRSKCDVVRDSIFNNIADTVSPQGVLAICHKKSHNPESFLINSGKQFILLGENLNDPGNIGALIRTGAAAGVTGVILTAGSGDIYNPKVLRAAAGAVLRLPHIVQDITLEEAVELVKKSQTPIYAAHPRGNNLPYNLDFCNNTCLLVGNESHGITDKAANLADALVTLPMVNNTESLNASVAGSVLMYEAVRQRL